MPTFYADSGTDKAKPIPDPSGDLDGDVVDLYPDSFWIWIQARPKQDCSALNCSEYLEYLSNYKSTGWEDSIISEKKRTSADL